MQLPENFKYTIVIKQKALAEIAPTISFENAALLDYIIQMCTSTSAAIEKQRSDDYTWINYKKIIKDMPLLKAKTIGPITTKVDLLEKEYRLIETKTIKVHGRDRKYFKLTPIVKSTLIGNGDTEFYHLLLSTDMDDDTALKIASDIRFLKYKGKRIIKELQVRKIEKPAGYIIAMYERWMTFGY